MIIINDDKAIKEDFYMPRVLKYKGKMSNTLLVVEDVLDRSKKNPDNHLCVCKCLRCGKIYPRLICIRHIREKSAKCRCTSYDKRYKFVDKKGQMLKFLFGERNKAKHESVFAEDYERVKHFEEIIDFLESNSLSNYFNDNIDLLQP